MTKIFRTEIKKFKNKKQPTYPIFSTCCIRPKRITTVRGPCLRPGVRITQFSFEEM